MYRQVTFWNFNTMLNFLQYACIRCVYIFMTLVLPLVDQANAQSGEGRSAIRTEGPVTRIDRSWSRPQIVPVTPLPQVPITEIGPRTIDPDMLQMNSGLEIAAAEGASFGERNALGDGWPLPQDTTAVQEHIGRVQQELSVKRGTLWDSPIIPVCWEDVGSFATERSWVQNAVAVTWEAESKLRFVGWNACPERFDGIRIKILDERPHTKGLGTDLRDKRDGMVLNFTYMNWGSDCAANRRFCIQASAVHEFGHAIGATHEHMRGEVTDQTCLGKREEGDIDGDYYVTPYDLDSIMNYCKPPWTGRGRLSRLDIAGVRALYGWNRSNSFEGPGVGHDGQGAGAALSDLNGNGRPDLLVMAVDAPPGDNTMRYRIGFDLNTDGGPQSWSDMFESPGMGHDAEGGGAAFGDINGNGRPDALLLTYDAPDGQNNFRYRIAWDLGPGGAPSGWSDVVITDGAGHLGDGAGVELADINRDGRLDLLVMAYDDGEGANDFRYKVGFGINASGIPDSWSPVYRVEGMGNDGEGAGVVVADILNNCANYLVLMVYDAPPGPNNFRHVILGPLASDGSPPAYASTLLTPCGTVAPYTNLSRMMPGLGHDGQGGGLAAGDIDRDGWLDLVLTAYDAPAGNNNFRYTVFFDAVAP